SPRLERGTGASKTQPRPPVSRLLPLAHWPYTPCPNWRSFYLPFSTVYQGCIGMYALLNRLFPTARTKPRRPFRVQLGVHGLEHLEERAQPSAAVDLGVAGQFAVLGLQSTAVTNNANVVGNVGVSQLGSFTGAGKSSVNGDIDSYSSGLVTNGHQSG